MYLHLVSHGRNRRVKNSGGLDHIIHAKKNVCISCDFCATSISGDFSLRKFEVAKQSDLLSWKIFYWYAPYSTPQIDLILSNAPNRLWLLAISKSILCKYCVLGIQSHQNYQIFSSSPFYELFTDLPNIHGGCQESSYPADNE